MLALRGRRSQVAATASGSPQVLLSSRRYRHISKGWGGLAPVSPSEEMLTGRSRVSVRSRLEQTVASPGGLELPQAGRHFGGVIVIPGKGLSVQRFGEVTCYEFAVLRGSSQNCGVSVHLLRVAFPWTVGLTVPYRLAENLALPLGLFQNFSPQRTAVAPQTPFSGSSSRTHSGFLPELQPFLLDWKSCEEMWISPKANPLGKASSPCGFCSLQRFCVYYFVFFPGLIIVTCKCVSPCKPLCHDLEREWPTVLFSPNYLL